jgi:signal transduction histidine kinase
VSDREHRRNRTSDARTPELVAPLLAALPDLVFRLDAEGRHLDYYSPSRDRLYTPPEVFTGRTVAEVLPDPVASLYLREIGTVLSSGEAREFEYELSLPAGDRHLYHARMVPASATEVLALVRDVTAHRQLEDRLRHTELQLQQAQKLEAIGRLAGGVAHDFNNLLTVITASTELLRDSLSNDPDALALVDEVMFAGQRAAQLTQQLLAFSRRQLLKPELLTLNSVVETAERLLRRAVGSDVELRTVLTREPWPVTVDRAQMEQVIMNLVVNARDAMPDGGEIVIETRNARMDEAADRELPPGEYACLSVRDAGAGMSGDVRDHIFEPFFTTKERGKGTGLGLPTAYGIVRQSGGCIRVDSEPGLGTVMNVLLPRAHSEPATAERREATLAPGLPRGVESVLVIEDEPSVRTLASTILRRCGYTVIDAEDGEAALAYLERPGREDIRLVVSDVVLPGLSGRRIAARIRERWPHMAVLFVSGYAEEPELQRDVMEHDHGILPKPFTPLDLARAARAAIDARR